MAGLDVWLWTARPFWRMQHSPLIGLVKLFPTSLSWTLCDFLSMDMELGCMDRQTTVTPYPMSFDHVLLALCSSFSLSFTLFLTVLLTPQTLWCSPVSSLVLEQAQHFATKLLTTQDIDHPVTLYIDTRARERTGKRTMKLLQVDLKQQVDGGTKSKPRHWWLLQASPRKEFSAGMDQLS